MLLLVGLGNPGSNYTNTRHNIGFKIIDAINNHFKLSKQKPKFKGLLTTGNIDEKKIYAIKPLTFMNNSGTAIKELIDYFKIDAKDVFVFHDDMDIDFGKIKAKFGGSSAGHNGIESIDKFIGKDYSRVRIGIGHPKQKKKVNNHVLEDFKDDEEEKRKKEARDHSNSDGDSHSMYNQDVGKSEPFSGGGYFGGIRENIEGTIKQGGLREEETNEIRRDTEDEKEKEEKSLERAEKGRHGADFYLPKRGNKVEEDPDKIETSVQDGRPDVEPMKQVKQSLTEAIKRQGMILEINKLNNSLKN